VGPKPWLLLRQVFIKELGCLLGFTSDQTPAPLAHAHPTQVFKTRTKRLSQKSITCTILIETETKYWFLLNILSREKDRPRVSESKIYISWVTYNHIELREAPTQKTRRYQCRCWFTLIALYSPMGKLMTSKEIPKMQGWDSATVL
jgi:hypothetical protein